MQTPIEPQGATSRPADLYSALEHRSWSPAARHTLLKLAEVVTREIGVVPVTTPERPDYLGFVVPDSLGRRLWCYAYGCDEGLRLDMPVAPDQAADLEGLIRGVVRGSGVSVKRKPWQQLEQVQMSVTPDDMDDPRVRAALHLGYAWISIHHKGNAMTNGTRAS